MRAVSRRRIDESTGDYVIENGRHTASQGILASVLLAMLTTRGKCVAAPELGTRTNSIQKLTVRSEREAEAYDREALKHLVDRREIVGLKVEALRGDGFLSRRISYTDRSGERIAVRVSRKVG